MRKQRKPLNPWESRGANSLRERWRILLPFGNETGFKRPALIVQDDDFNRSHINTVIVIPFSTNLMLSEAPGNVFLAKEETGLSKDSVLVTSLIASIDRTRLVARNSIINTRALIEIEEGIRIVLGM